MTLALGFGLLLLVAVLTSFGQICFKVVAVKELSLVRKFLHPIFLIGGFLFVCGPVLTSLAAQVIDFSILYAMTSLNFVIVLFLSRWLLGERIDWPKIVGVGTIVVGLLIMVSG